MKLTSDLYRHLLSGAATLTLCLSVLIIISPSAHAYFDPGTGALIIQGLIGTALYILANIKRIWRNFGLNRNSGNSCFSHVKLRHLLFGLLAPCTAIIFTISRTYYYGYLLFGTTERMIESILVLSGISFVIILVASLLQYAEEKKTGLAKLHPVGIWYLICTMLLFHVHLKPIYSVLVDINALLIFPLVLVVLLLPSLCKVHLQKIILCTVVVCLAGSSFTLAGLGKLETELLRKQVDTSHMQRKFKTKPNIYLIQPDSFVNLDALQKPPYKIDVSEFTENLSSQGFTLYPEFYSNYSSTLSSNMALFTGKYHQYEGRYSSNSSEILAARYQITQENPVLQTFHENGYQTYVLPNSRYLLTEGCGYTYCPPIESPLHIINYLTFSDVHFSVRPFLSSEERKNKLENILSRHNASPKFFFLEDDSKPGHISGELPAIPLTDKEWIQREAEQRDRYERRLKRMAITWVNQTVETILAHDPGALIIIMADHGPSLGNKCTRCPQKQTNLDGLSRAQLNSIFGAFLAIRWPEDYPENFDQHIKSPVNFFSVLFSFLEGREQPENLLTDVSYFYLEPLKKPVKALRHQQAPTVIRPEGRAQ